MKGFKANKDNQNLKKLILFPRNIYIEKYINNDDFIDFFNQILVLDNLIELDLDFYRLGDKIDNITT